MMKFKLLGGLCAMLVIGQPLSALAQIGVITVPSEFDYRYKPKDETTDDFTDPDPDRVDPPIYEVLPNLDRPNRTLPSAFSYPIIYAIAVDESITSDALITDEIFLATLPAIPTGVTLDDIPRTRAEYTRAVEEWGELVQECLTLNPLLIRENTGNPILISQEPAGRIVFNANLIAVCPLP